MRISARGRYALAAATILAEQYDSGKYISVVNISDRLSISKIYLEQVFSLIKRGGVVNSAKGAQGGYQLAREPEQVTAYEVLSAVELPLFESTEPTVKDKAPEIETALREKVFDVIDVAVKDVLNNTTLSDLLMAVEKNMASQQLMFYI